MLNKNKSQKQNVWKYGLILPLLIGFIISFNVKTIAQSSVSETINSQKPELSSIIINKYMTNEGAEMFEKLYENLGIDLKFSKIKRNEKGEIISIFSSYKYTYGNGSNSAFDENGINPFKFFVELGINKKIISVGYTTNMNYEFTDNNNDTNYSQEVSKEITSLENPIYYLDNKKISKEEFEKIKPEEINSLTVIKDKEAIQKYGEEARNGVIEITTKNPWKVTGGIMPPTDENTPAMELLSKTVPDYKQFNINKSLIFINHKESTIDEFKKIKAIQLESAAFKNKEEAIKKYGEKAKYGAIEITTKK